MPMSDYDPIFQAAGAEWNVDPTLLKAVMAQESQGNPRAVSKANAQGLMQITPETQQRLGVTDPYDPVQSIYGGAKYLAEGLAKEKTPEGALLYYHGGPGWRSSYGPESQGYVPGVTKYYQQFAPKPTQAAATDDPFTQALSAAKSAPSDKAAADPFSDALTEATKAAAPPSALPDKTVGVASDGVPITDARPDLTVPGMRAALAPAPNTTYGDILPIAKDNATGALRPALPNGLRTLAQGGLDLLEGPQTGTVTPSGTMALMGMSPASVAERAGNPLIAAAAPAERVEPSFSATTTAAPPVPGGPQPGMGPVPQSVGAAATPATSTAMGAKEALASQATGEMQRVLTPAKQGRDATIYVPGTQPTGAEVDGTAATALEQKVTSQNPAAIDQFQQRIRQNNEARVEYYDQAAGTPTMVNRLAEARSQQATADLQTAFGNKTPVDPSNVADAIKGILADPRLGQSDDIKKYVGPLLGKLEKSDGTPITDPEALYGVRENINQMLSKASIAEKPTVGNVKGQLLDIKSALDHTIEQGAPGYQQYLANYAAASRPIEAMQLLQDLRPSLTNAKGDMLPGRFDRAMKDLASDRGAQGVNPAKSISEDQWDALNNIHSDLKRLGNIDMSNPRGSDTNMLTRVTSGAVELGAHALAANLTGGVANILIPGIKQGLKNRSTAKSANRLLNPEYDDPTLH